MWVMLSLKYGVYNYLAFGFRKGLSGFGEVMRCTDRADCPRRGRQQSNSTRQAFWSSFSFLSLLVLVLLIPLLTLGGFSLRIPCSFCRFPLIPRLFFSYSYLGYRLHPTFFFIDLSLLNSGDRAVSCHELNMCVPRDEATQGGRYQGRYVRVLVIIIPSVHILLSLQESKALYTSHITLHSTYTHIRLSSWLATYRIRTLSVCPSMYRPFLSDPRSTLPSSPWYISASPTSPSPSPNYLIPRSYSCSFSTSFSNSSCYST